MAQQTDQNKTLLIAGGLALLYIAGNKIFQKLGIVKTAEDVADDKAVQQLNTENYFDPSYWENYHKTYTTLTLVDGGKAYAKKIYDAKGFFNDDEDAVYGVFRSLQAKTQISQIAKAFYLLYNADLKNYLEPPNGFLSDKEWLIVVGIASKLPKGIKVGGVWQ